MWPLEFLREPFGQRLAMALVHFLWQGLIVAGVYLAAIHLFAVRRPQARYVLSLVALAAILACPLATLFVQCLRPSSVPAVAAAPPSLDKGATAVRAKTLPAADDAGVQFEIAPSPDAPAANQPAARSFTAWSFAAWLPTLAGWLRAAQPGVVAVWALGVVILSARMCLGLATLAGLKRRGRPVSSPVDECVGRLCRRLGLGRMPRVLISDRVPEASAVGFFRPLVLLPAAWLAQLPPEVLEAVIAHELAHIRRWDLWANLFQRVVESLLFYHPAVWWLSRRVRTERELCCDELAVTATGQRVVYASALELVARRRLARVRPALGAGISIGDRRMALLNRVRHVLGRVPAQRFAGWWPAGLVGLAVLAAAWMAASNWSAAVGAEDGDRAVKRDGDRPAAREGERREGDRREGDRPVARDGERREGDRPAAREGERAPIGPQELGRLVQTINELRAQVDELRREVRELRAATGRERVQPREGQPGPVARERMENVRRRIAELRGAGKVEEAERLAREAQGAPIRERLGAMERRVDELRKAGKMDAAEQAMRELQAAEAKLRIEELRRAGKLDEAQRIENELRQAPIRERLGAMERRVKELREAGKMDAAEQAMRELQVAEAKLRIEELRRAGKVEEAERIETELKQALQKQAGQKPAQARLEAMERRVNELRQAGKMDAAEQAMRELKLAAAKVRAAELRAAGKVEEAEKIEMEIKKALQKEGGDKPARARLEAMERRVNELRKAGKMDAAEQALRELKLAAAKVRAAELRAAGKVEEAEKIEVEIKQALQKKDGEVKKEFEKVKADLEKKTAEAEKPRGEGEKKDRPEKEKAEKKEGGDKEKAEKNEKEGGDREKAEKKDKEGGDKEKAEKNEKEGGDKEKGDKR